LQEFDGLITQLEFEKYSHEDAVYGADHCNADWNEQAAKMAKAYQNSLALIRWGYSIIRRSHITY
jgi:hypothetical protein